MLRIMAILRLIGYSEVLETLERYFTLTQPIGVQTAEGPEVWRFHFWRPSLIFRVVAGNSQK